MYDNLIVAYITILYSNTEYKRVFEQEDHEVIPIYVP